MKKIFLALILSAIATVSLSALDKSTNKKLLWAKLEQCITNRTPESATEPISQLQSILSKEKLADQSAKLLIYRMKFAQMNEEKSLPDFIKQMETELKTSWFPYNNLLNTMLAEGYLQYYNQNRYSFYNRKTQNGTEEQEIENLTSAQIFEKINNHLIQSLSQPDKLSETAINQWDAIIEKGTKPFNLRNTLLDFLTWRAVELYGQCNNLNSRPAEEFTPSDKAYFGTAQEFVNLKIESKDSLNNNYLALLAIQSLTKRNLNSKELEKTINIDLERIEFLDGINFAYRDLYIETLNKLARISNNLPIYSLIKYKIAQYEHTNATTQSIKKALELCKEGYTAFPKSEGGINCKALENEILTKSIDVKIEEIYPSSNQVIGRLEVKNVTKIYGRIYKSKKTINDIDTIINRQKFIREFEININAPQDYLNHNQEFTLDSLQTGNYALITSANKDFSKSNNIRIFNNFQVTNIAVIIDLESNSHPFLLLNRKTGKPISNAKFNLTTYSEYSFRGVSSSFSLKSNEHGEVQINNVLENMQSYQYTVNVDGDILTEEQRYFYQNRDPQIFARQEDFIFTDRKIYRPNQPIYYKIITFITDGKKANVKAGEQHTITLRDMNGKTIANQTVTTNKFGSASGMFTIPMGGLNGDWSIASNNGQTIFQVEEYKRPKFEVNFLPVNGLYITGDTVIIEGTAKSYTKIEMENCMVKIQVSSDGNPTPLYYRCIPNIKEPQAINIDTIRTDKTGKFKFKFITPKSSLGGVTYTINADLTSSLGETITATSDLFVGESLALISAQIQPSYEYKSASNMVITKTNNNGTPVNIGVNYEIYSLNTDLPLIAPKLWDDGYYQDFELTTYKLKSLPYTPEGLELSKLKTKELIAKGKLGIYEDSISATVVNKLPAGVYRIIIKGEVNRGDSIIENYNFTIINSQSPLLESPTFLHINCNKHNFESTDTIKFTVGSSLIGADVYYQIAWDKNTEIDKIFTSNNSKTEVKVPIPSNYSGMAKINIFTVSDNRIYLKEAQVNVVSKSKELTLKLTTFRDKITPNSKEKWQIAVKYDSVKTTNSELLVTMYDASLDAFTPNYFQNFYSLFSINYYNRNINLNMHSLNYGNTWNTINKPIIYSNLTFPSLNWHEFFNSRYGAPRMYSMERMSNDEEEISVRAAGSAPVMLKNTIKFTPPVIKADAEVQKNKSKVKEDAQAKEPISKSDVPRKNLQETAFFLPHLTTDSAGVSTFEFTSPEALTTWKLMAFAHTADGKSGTLVFNTTTQKELMVAPNLPRFLYQDDRILLKTNISRLSNTISNGKVKLTLTDENGKNIDALIEGIPEQNFKFSTENNLTVSWWIAAKGLKSAIYVKISAETDGYSDGEQRLLPILPNTTRMVESLPFYDIEKGSKSMNFNKLKENASKVDNSKLTISYTQNSSWEVIKAMPYLLENSQENSDELFDRYFANALSINIVKNNPNIEQTLTNWANASDGNKNALISNLESNEEAKSLLLDQTPWYNDGKSETASRKRLALLLNPSKTVADRANTLSKLLANQMANGAWPWFKGMDASEYVSQYILIGLIQMAKDSVDTELYEPQYWQMVASGINYMDNVLIKNYRDAYKQLNTSKKDTIIIPTPSLTDIEYLASRKLCPTVELPKELQEIEKIYLAKVKNHWTDYSIENQALIAQWLYRNGNHEASAKIMESLFQCAIKQPEMGNYYKREAGFYGYFRNDIQKHSNILKAFAEIGGYNNHVKLMQLYLIQNKRTNNWEGSKASISAITALLLGNEKWFATPTKSDKLFVGNEEIVPDAVESSTGTFSKSWNGTEITSSLADIKIDKYSTTPSWGSMIWEYFTAIDQVETNNQNPLKVKREYLKETETLRGKVYEPVNENSILTIGEKVLVRLTLTTDRPMDYIHLKDNRASSMETLELFSGYNYNGGVGYYQNMKDASSNFYLEHLPKGTWKVEYATRVSQIGTLKSGICTVQCYYAPEFSNQTRSSSFTSKE